MENLVFALVMIGLILILSFYGIAEEKQKTKMQLQKFRAERGKRPEKRIKTERYERIGGYLKQHEGDAGIDGITWDDLEMDRVFQRLDYTVSAAGEEYLYYLLHAPKTQEELDDFESVVRAYQENEDLTVSHRMLFWKLGNTGKYSMYDYLHYLADLGEKSAGKEALWNLLYVPAFAALFLMPAAGIVCVVAVMLFQMLTYLKKKEEIEPYMVSMAFISRLCEIGGQFQKRKEDPFAAIYERMKKYRGALSLSQFGSSMVFSAQNVKMGSNPLELLLDYVKMITHLDLILFYSMVRQIRSHEQDIDGLLCELGRMEAALCVSLFRLCLTAEEKEYTVPEFTDGPFTLEEGYHPLIDHPVCNSITAKTGVLLTGSNASGKSTFLKTAALAALLAQTVHTVPAKGYRAPCYRIFSSMSLRDHLECAESYFIVEIKAMKRILDFALQEPQPVLCFVDEVLRGTNTVERIAAASQILKSLGRENITCFAATHDLELAELLKDSYENYHFEEEIRDGDVCFSYRLQEGKARTRNAIRLLEVLQYPKELVQAAQTMADTFLRTGIWQA